uniref:Cyclin-dependent kinase inhibitor 1B n=1 Tax=Takifugu rubripes TaxID=31033 RepID=A0A3B5K090_TAKRU
MSDVRLSNASPTLERVDARQPDNVTAPVRRNLFGSPDRGEIRRYLTAAIQEGVQDFMEEYNFDPDSERPLTPHNYEWQEDNDAPEFYRRPPHRRESPRRDVEPSGDDRLEADGRQRSENSSRKRRSAESAGHSHRLYARSPARTPPPPLHTHTHTPLTASLKICTHAFLILQAYDAH